MKWLAPIVTLINKVIGIWRQRKRRKRERKAREYYERLKNDADFADAEYRRMFVVSDGSDGDAGRVPAGQADDADNRGTDDESATDRAD